MNGKIENPPTNFHKSKKMFRARVVGSCRVSPICFSDRRRKPPQEPTVFQPPSPCHEVSIQDAWDAYDTCSLMSTPAERDACYALFGVDGDKVERYLHVVEMLNMQLEEPLLDIQVGPFHIKIDQPSTDKDTNA